MKILSLRIKNFENIEYYSTIFKEKNLLSYDPGSKSIVKAIGIVLKNPALYGNIEDLVFSEKTQINATIQVEKAIYRIFVRVMNNKFVYLVGRTGIGEIEEDKFYDLISNCPEEEQLSYFEYDTGQELPEKFGKYMDYDYFYSREEFQKQTDGMGVTNTFSKCLREHIKDYEKEKIPGKEKKEIVINKDGNFVVQNKDGKEIKEKNLQDKEKNMLKLVSFISLNEFWEKMEKIRNIHYVEPPVVIINPEQNSAKTNKDFITKKVDQLNRQVFMFSKEKKKS